MTLVQLDHLGAEVRQTQSRLRACDFAPVESGIQRLLERAHVIQTRKRYAVWGALSLASAAAAVLLVVGLLARTDKLGFSIGASREMAFESQWIWAQDTEPVPVRFSDGTTVELSPDTRARVGRMGRATASVTLETGEVRAQPGADADWFVAAGPFGIHGPQSDLDVAWDPESQVLEVEVNRGSAQVDGPVLAGDQVVTAAQRLTIALREKQITISFPAAEARQF